MTPLEIEKTSTTTICPTRNARFHDTFRDEIPTCFSLQAGHPCRWLQQDMALGPDLEAGGSSCRICVAWYMWIPSGKP